MGKPRPFKRKEFLDKNERRHALINKMFKGGGLTEEESHELEILHKWVGKYINKYAPLPELPPELQALIDKLKLESK